MSNELELSFDLGDLLGTECDHVSADVAALWAALIHPLPLAAACHYAVLAPDNPEPLVRNSAREEMASLGETPVIPVRYRDDFSAVWPELTVAGPETTVLFDPCDNGSVRFGLIVRRQGGVYGYVIGQGFLFPTDCCPPGIACAYPSEDACRIDLARLVYQLEAAAAQMRTCQENLEQLEARLRHKANEVQVLSARYAEISRENITQHEKLRDTNQLLEVRVRERTAELRRTNTALEKQLSIVGDLQRSLLPSEFPPHPGYAWAPFYQPSEEASGDYFDVIPIDERYISIVVADVCGHGAAAATMMAMARILLRSHVREYPDPGQMLSYVNEVLYREVGSFIFITMIYVMLDTHTGTMKYASAGHPAPFLIHGRRRTVDQLPLAGDVPLNLSENRRYESHSFQIDPNDSVFFYTDGVTEVFNPDGEMFGDERLYEVLLQNTDQPAEMIVARVIDAANAFANHLPMKDDFTLLVVQRTAA